VVPAVPPQAAQPPPSAAEAPPQPRLILVSLGTSSDPAGPATLLPRVAQRLSGATGLPLRSIPQPHSPPQALADLLIAPGPWLAPLPLDFGLALAQGSWAEALGAWRQPTLLVVDQAQLGSGIPAAATALLERWSVPLVGLLQWGGSWDVSARRRDELPWLGLLGDPQGSDPEGDPAAGLLLSWSRWRDRLA